MKSISLSEFPNDTYVYIKNEKRKELFDKLEKKYGFLTKCNKDYKNPSGAGDIYDWRKGFCIKKNNKIVKRYIPITKLKMICKDLNININSLQKDISFIKVNSRSGGIKNPKLPLKIVPETFAILAHLISDGYGGENGNACYVNMDDEAIDNFIKKLKIAFGDVEYYILKKHIRVIIPRLIPKILKKYFGIKDLRSSKSILTKKIWYAPRKHLLEFLKAIIIDEGSIRDHGIEINFLANPKLTTKVKNLCEKRLKYICKYAHKNRDDDSCKNSFIISGENFHRIKEEIKDFVIPRKQKKFLKWFKRKSRPWYNKYKGTTKKKIIKALTYKPLTGQELAYKINVGYGGIMDQVNGYNLKGKRIKGLADLGIVGVKEIGWKGASIFCIKNRDKALSFLNEK